MELRAALDRVPPSERDAWLDRVLGLELVEDGPSLPRGCVPYLPAPVDKLLHVAEHVRADDVFVDVGSGAGRALVVIRLLTGAAAIGLEIQPQLATASRALAARAGADRVTVVEGDAAVTIARATTGTVFFLYCPFGGDRLLAVLAELELLARVRPIRVCCLDLPLPDCPWLALVSEPSRGLAIYRSVTS